MYVTLTPALNLGGMSVWMKKCGFVQRSIAMIEKITLFVPFTGNHTICCFVRYKTGTKLHVGNIYVSQLLGQSLGDEDSPSLGQNLQLVGFLLLFVEQFT